uniref:Uncharacterized protein n=1 Tax=Anguilla anguilla TaxID=7936 RepID=A0A0E9USG5_ANGAN
MGYQLICCRRGPDS